MKLLKKSFLVILILMVTFIITSCSSSQDIVTFTGDRPVRGEVSGTVVETFNDDNPVEGVSIKADDEIVSSGADGSYTLHGVDDNTEITVSKDGYESVSKTIEIEEDGDLISQDFRINKDYSEDNNESDDSDNEENGSEDETNLIETELLIELSWLEGAEDLDAHLIVPDRDNPDQKGYHIYYDDQGSLNDYPDAALDKDILTYEKEVPERIKIEKLSEGRYTYFIKIFSMFDAEEDDEEEIPEISESEAMVRIRENGEWAEYNVPESETGMYWHLFEIEVNEDGYEIKVINEITDDLNGLDPEVN
ncbi:MAG: hypothetical protein ABR596_01110 [Halarsenatibacteraceae bacterium]